MKSGADVVVVGAGIVGSAIAFHLARVQAGRVTLVDAGYPGAGTRRSAGVVRRLCADSRVSALASLSLPQFASWPSLVGADCGFNPTGAVIAARGREADLLGMQTDRPPLARHDFRALFPWYELAPQAVAYLDEQAGTADPEKARRTLKAAAARFGALIESGVQVLELLAGDGRVRGVRTTRADIESDVVVVANGPWAPPLLAGLGWAPPIRTLVTELLVIDRTPVSPIMPLLDLADGLLVRPYRGGRTLVGSRHAQPAVVGRDSPSDFPMTRILAQLAVSAPSLFAGRVRCRWSGYYDMSPDARPILGPLPGLTGLMLAIGLSGGGLKLAPAIGLLLANLILTGRPSRLLHEFFPSEATGHQVGRSHAHNPLEWQFAEQQISTLS